MELDLAFKMAVKKFYEGQSHQSVDKYSKIPFRYTYDALDEAQKKLAGTAPEVEDEVEEVDNTEEEDLEDY